MINQYVDISSYICFKDDETELTAKCGHNILFTCKKPASEPWPNKSTILYIFLPTLGVHLYIQNCNLRLFEPFPSFRYQWSVQLKIFSSIYSNNQWQPVNQPTLSICLIWLSACVDGGWSCNTMIKLDSVYYVLILHCGVYYHNCFPFKLNIIR